MTFNCIIIPFYNESSRFPEKEFIQHQSNTNNYYLLVNDGSTDSTYEILKRLKTSNPKRIEVLNLEQNVGKGEAVRNGILRAMRWKEFDYIAVFDADFATPLAELEYMLSFIKPTHKLIVASRWKHLGANINRNELRHYLGRIFATCVSISLQMPVYDTQCGAKIISSELAYTVFKEPFISRWLFDVEVFHRVKTKYGKKSNDEVILEVPLRNWEEKGGSKLKISDFLKAPLELWKIHRKYANLS